MDSHEVLILIVGIFSILLGLLIIIRPKILAWIVGVYLMASGILWSARAFLD